MRVLKLASQMMICVVMLAGLSSNSYGALELRLANVVVDGPGPLTNVRLDVFITWDGNGENSVQDIGFDIVTPASVTLRNTNVPPNPLGFLLRSVNAGAVEFTHLSGGVTPLSIGETRLTTLGFDVDASFGLFDITFGNFRAGNIEIIDPDTEDERFVYTDITNELSALGGSISVVPEPSALALIGLASFGLGFRRNRRTAA